MMSTHTLKTMINQTILILNIRGKDHVIFMTAG